MSFRLSQEETRMKYSKSTITKKILLSFFAFGFSTSTYATGALVTFANNTNAIPTLSTTMLMVLSVLLFAVAFKVSKQKNSAKTKMFVTLLGVTAVVAISNNGIKLINNVQASLESTPLMIVNPPVRIGEVGGTGGEADFYNGTGEAITIQSIAVDEGSQCFFPFGGDNCVPTNLYDGDEVPSLPFTGILSSVRS